MPELDGITEQVAKHVAVDLLNGPGALPTIYVRHTPAELVVFDGQPDFQPVGTTGLLWAANTRSDVLFDSGDNQFYVLAAGRWYRSTLIAGPWSFVSSKDLPAYFREIPTGSPAGVVLSTVAGTPQAKEAVIEASIPRTATVPLKGGPEFTPVIDGLPQLRPIEGTALHYVVNSPTPIIETAPEHFYALQSGIWFFAPSLDGPWTVATSVPDAIYGIPPASPLHYVTYVDIYGATPEDVDVGYTQGYLGSVVAPDGVVVYGTGYDYQPWIGTEWYPPPVTYGVAAEPVYNPAVGWAYGTALGLTTAAMADSWDNNNHNDYYAPYYHGYPCCGSTSAHVYGQYGDTYSSGTEKWYSNSNGNVGRSYSGSYTDYRTGTTGNVSASQNFNEQTGETTDKANRSFATPEGTTGNVQRSESYDPQNRDDLDQRVRLRHQPLRRHRERAAHHQLRCADRPVELRRVALRHRCRRQHGEPADHRRGRRRPIAGEPRDHDLQRAHRADQQLRPRRGRRPALRRQRRQRLPQQRRRLAAA